jgi:long-chain fatty acid transport protein
MMPKQRIPSSCGYPETAKGGRIRLALLASSCLLALQIALPQPAAASFFDTFGVSAKGMALGNAMVSMTEGWESVYYNPAGLALGRDIEVSFGLLCGLPNLKVAYKEGPEEKQKKSSLSGAPLDTLAGPVFGLVIPVQKCTPKKLPMPWALGVGLFVPRQALVTSRVVGDGYPFDVIFNERNNTLSLYTGLATRITPAFYLGVGLAAQLVTPVEMLFTSGGAQNAVDLEARFGSPSFLFGFLIRPTERIRIGIVYRDETKVRSQWDTRVKTQYILRYGSRPGSYIALYDDQTLSTDYVTGYTPEAVTFGLSYKLVERVRLSGEATWYHWGGYGGPSGTGLPFEFNDVWVLRLGLLYRLRRDLDLRFGFFYEPTPVSNQGQGFYPIGNDRYVPSAGIGYTFKDPWGVLAKPVALDAYFQFHALKAEEFKRAIPPNPFTLSQDVTSKGYVINLGCNVTLHF